MNRWFRLYDEVLDDPKVQRLPDRLFKTWINILCAASRNEGVVPPLPELAFMLRREEGKLFADLNALVTAGLLDQGEGMITPHNWKGRQFQSDGSTDRVKRFRNAQRNVSSDVSETPPETEQNRAEAETQQIQIKDRDLSVPKLNGSHSAALAAAVRGVLKPMDAPSTVFLKPSDTRVPRAQVWHLEHFGTELAMTFKGRSPGYVVPWEAVR